MAVPHAQPGEAIRIEPDADTPEASRTTTLIKSTSVEVIRLVMAAGKEFPRHQVEDEITIQCLTGNVTLHAGDKTCDLTPGKLTYLSGGEPHSLIAKQDSMLLLTIVLSHKHGTLPF